MENALPFETLTDIAPTGPREGSLSGVAAGLARGVCRYFATAGCACLLEAPLKSGRRADVMAMGSGGEITIVEIKSGPQDYRTDRKWREYREFCDAFFFCVGGDFPLGLIPEDVGLIVADRYDAAVIRRGEPHRLSGARRKAVNLRFGRLAALRLQTLLDPPDRYTS